VIAQSLLTVAHPSLGHMSQFFCSLLR
jgi:hypothetical protein